MAKAMMWVVVWCVIGGGQAVGQAVVDVVFVGDSMTKGYTFGDNSTPEAPIKHFTDDDDVPRAIARHGWAWSAAASAKDGITSYSWDRHDAWSPADPAGFSRVESVRALRPKLVVVMLGTNDVLQSSRADVADGRTVDQMVETYTQAIDALLARFTPEASVLLVKPMGVLAGEGWLDGVDVGRANAALDDHIGPYLKSRAVERADVYFYDLDASFRSIAGWRDYYNDGIHVYKVHEGVYGFSLVLEHMIVATNEVLEQLEG